MEIKHYCNSLTKYNRYKSREVKIGNIGIGGANPIRVQSMTTTDTMDTEATVAQSIRMIDAGCELVRITAPGKKDAENLKEIKAELVKRGYDTPLVADIHFTPAAAEIAAKIVEKVRVNPGNYADQKKFKEHEYTEESYQAALDRIRKRFTPLVEICKANGTAMRIGTNHGSLSDRIMSRYGDTPLGMVESALEFLRICRDLDYHEIILSMKASNTLVMVQAYRLLIQKMTEEGMNYPLHLGVTEAGEGEDGRIKSAVGIGTLLEDGIGDTVRVSLTEEPEEEIPVAKALVAPYDHRNGHTPIAPIENEIKNPFEYHKRTTRAIRNIGASNVPVVCADLSTLDQVTAANLFVLGYQYSVPLDKWNIGDMACDYIFIGNRSLDFELPGTLAVIQNEENWSGKPQHFPMFEKAVYEKTEKKSDLLNFVRMDASDLDKVFVARLDESVVIVLDTDNAHAMAAQRRFFYMLNEIGAEIPVIVRRQYDDRLTDEDYQLYASRDLGALLVDGFSDGVWSTLGNTQRRKMVNATLFGLLQAARVRISKTEYISCPSCGRTLFDLQKTTARIRERTNHLKGVKIGIMGCIVNGPGEMADADYGYVGTGVGKITLYKGQEVVTRSIETELAVDALIDLIKEHGDWVEREI